MLVCRRSMITGEYHNRDLAVTEEQMKRYTSGQVLLQDAFPNLPREEREFIKTGITPEEWLETFGSGE